MRILLAYSGGLDTSYLIAWLTRSEGHEVSALTVDCGGFEPLEKQAMADRALELGAVEHRFVDAKSELFERVLRWLIAGNVRRGGTYPLCVGAERGLQAEILARVAREGGFDAVCHGCTAAGNDQVRFETALATIAPELEVLAPVRDAQVSREAEREFLTHLGLPVPPAGGRHSINAGLWGLTIGGGEMATSTLPLPDEAWQWTRGGAGSIRLEIGFERGVPLRLNGETLAPATLIERLNAHAGAVGVGRGYHTGDTVLGIKGRIAYEAPAAEVLLSAHRELEKLVLTEDQRLYKDQLGELYGRRLHQGLFHDPFQRDVEALFVSSQARVSGTVRVALSNGCVVVDGVESPHSMLDASDALYGERCASHTNPAWAQGLGRTLAEPARLYRRAEQRAHLAEVGQ